MWVEFSWSLLRFEGFSPCTTVGIFKNISHVKAIILKPCSFQTYTVALSNLQNGKYCLDIFLNTIVAPEAILISRKMEQNIEKYKALFTRQVFWVRESIAVNWTRYDWSVEQGERQVLYSSNMRVRSCDWASKWRLLRRDTFYSNGIFIPKQNASFGCAVVTSSELAYSIPCTKIQSIRLQQVHQCGPDLTYIR